MDDVPPWEDDPTVTVVCPYCFLKHGPGLCAVRDIAVVMLATLTDEDGLVQQAMSGD